MHFPGKTEAKHRKRFSLICYALRCVCMSVVCLKRYCFWKLKLAREVELYVMEVVLGHLQYVV